MLHVHRAERADALVAALAALLADPLPDPLTTEVVAVPTRGMERWLTQRLSAGLGATPGRGDGVCANVAFPSPGRLAGDAVAVATGLDPDADPWRVERAVWPLLDVVEASLGEPWLAALTAHLGGSGDTADPVRRTRRFSAVRHLAELFDRYALHRPRLVRGWAAGEEPGDWQAELWRRLRERIGRPGPAERLAGACARLGGEPGLCELPPRLALFGLTRLPAGHLQVLRALAAHRDVHAFVLHPSPALWERVAAATTGRPPVRRRRDDATATLGANRLLASWGHDARELQLVLGAGGARADHHHPVAHRADTLLARLQAGVRADRPAPGPPLGAGEDARTVLAPDDDSVRVHACHGRARQVEVVRDAILHRLAEDPTLEPRDVIVMCPDIEAFAPLIQATFGAGEAVEEDEVEALPAPERPPDLRVRLADRSLRHTNPLLGVVARLLELAEQRLTASQVLDLADREPVRRRFRLDDDDLGRLEEWVAGSGVRWGLDAADRARFGLGTLAAGTWRAGLDRLLLGVTMTEEDQRLFGGVLPLEDVDSGAIDLAGRLAELVDRLQAAVASLRAPQALGAWAAAVAGAADGLTATTPRDAWQRVELQRLLADVVAEASAGDGLDLALPEIRALLAERLRGRPTRANFRTGHLTICTLVPMRSVPHRVVCVLGLDDGLVPRRTPRDGDDRLLDDPHVGDRDGRTEDRQMLLDALLAATDHLIVTYTGNDERTNLRRPPAVPVGELLDAVDATARTAGGAPAREHVEVRHPLQPFDARNFKAGALARGRPWSFDRVTLDGARALTAPRAAPGPFLAAPLPPRAGSVVELADLVRFVEHPVRAFLRQRLGMGVGDFSDEVADALPVELDGLGRWGVGQRLLEARLTGAERRPARRAEVARGTLPPGMLGRPVVDAVEPTVERLVGAAAALVGDPGSVDVRVTLPDGRSLSGTVPGVSGDLLCVVVFSRVGPKHRLAAWTRLLALTAAHPERPFAAAVVGRSPSGGDVRVVRFAPLDAGAALAHLATLLDLYDRGLREPLPLACATSAAYAAAAVAGRDARTAARQAWTSRYRFDGEDRDAEHALVLGGERPLEALLAAAPAPGEAGAGWEEAETTRFGRLARRLWAGPLACEQVG